MKIGIKVFLPNPETGLVIQIHSLFRGASFIDSPNRRRNRDVGEGGHKHPLHLEPADLFIEVLQFPGKMLRPEDGTVAAGVILVKFALYGLSDVHFVEVPHLVVLTEYYKTLSILANRIYDH